MAQRHPITIAGCLVHSLAAGFAVMLRKMWKGIEVNDDLQREFESSYVPAD